MNFDDYQEWCKSGWKGSPSKYTLKDDFIMCTGLPGETGEVLELLKKAQRDQKDIKLVDKKELTKELGDVFFYLNTNIKKLTARRKRNKK